MTNRIRWGILGTGKIAHQFDAALRRLPDADLLTAGSRFADEFEIAQRCGVMRNWSETRKPK